MSVWGSKQYRWMQLWLGEDMGGIFFPYCQNKIKKAILCPKNSHMKDLSFEIFSHLLKLCFQFKSSVYFLQSREKQGVTAKWQQDVYSRQNGQDLYLCTTKADVKKKEKTKVCCKKNKPFSLHQQMTHRVKSGFLLSMFVFCYSKCNCLF